MSESIRTDIGRFGIVPEHLLDSGVSSHAIRLFALLAAKWANREGEGAHPSRRTIATALDASLATVDRALAELRAVNAITVEARRSPAGDQTSNAYVLHFAGTPSAPHLITPLVTRDDTLITDDYTPLVTLEDTPLVTSDAQSISLLNHNQKEPEKDEEGAAPPPPASLEGWKERMRGTKHQGDRVAVLVDVVHSQTGIKRDGGMAAALLKKVGDPEVAVERTWASLKADGDPFRYAMAIGTHAKAEHGALTATGGGQTAAEYRKAHQF
jgi:hypothetical protein